LLLPNKNEAFINEKKGKDLYDAREKGHKEIEIIIFIIFLVFFFIIQVFQWTN